jgi:hypothetical protein
VLILSNTLDKAARILFSALKESKVASVAVLSFISSIKFLISTSDMAHSGIHN